MIYKNVDDLIRGLEMVRDAVICEFDLTSNEEDIETVCHDLILSMDLLSLARDVKRDMEEVIHIANANCCSDYRDEYEEIPRGDLRELIDAVMQSSIIF